MSLKFLHVKDETLLNTGKQYYEGTVIQDTTFNRTEVSIRYPNIWNMYELTQKSNSTIEFLVKNSSEILDIILALPVQFLILEGNV